MTNTLTLHGASTALFSTWFMVEEWGVLFDCGDGVSAALMHKARKVRHVFLSHPDRDHISGMLQFHQLYGGSHLRIYYPADAGSFAPLAEFCTRFDPQITGTTWVPLTAGDVVDIGKGRSVRAIENGHIRGIKPGIRSLSFIVQQSVRKLRAEHHGKTGPEIAALRKAGGNDAITDLSVSVPLIYGADTPVETDGRYDDADILIHEATFLNHDDGSPDDPRRFKHSMLDDVLAMVATTRVRHLVLTHFSSRYSAAQINGAVRAGAEAHSLTCAISLVLPGMVSRDILSDTLPL